VTPVQISKFHRGERYQILPAYAQDGIVMSRIFIGSTDAAFFEDLIQQLLQHCGRWPEPKSVLVMDNASFHHSERVKQLLRHRLPFSSAVNLNDYSYQQLLSPLSSLLLTVLFTVR
jgi:hypothetical protein